MSSQGDDEQSPLLSPTSTSIQPSTYLESFRQSWPVYRVLLVALLIYMGNIGSVPAAIAFSRNLACAQYYHKQTEVYRPPTEHLCRLDEIEKNSANILLTINVINSMTSCLSMLYIGPRISAWGRKPVLLLSTFVVMFTYVSALFLPLGYPFKQRSQILNISPDWASRIFIGFALLGGCLGGDSVPTCCLRLMIADRSTVSTKTSNYLFLTLTNLLGVSLGPALASLVADRFPLTQLPIVGWWSFQQLPPPHKDPVPPLNPDVAYTNITSFLVGITLLGLAALCNIILLPADHAIEEEDTTFKESSKNYFTIFTHLWPQHDINGQLDWRLIKVIIISSVHIAAAYSINVYLQFFGNFLEWGPEAVGYLLSWLGITRIFTVVLIVPLWVVVFERTTRRSAILQRMSLSEIKMRAKGVPVDEAPENDTSAINLPQDAPQQGASHTVEGAIAMWRARVDRRILQTSWIFDIFGWLTAFTSTLLSSTSGLLLGGVVTAIGGASMPARISVDLVIVGDVFARRRNELQTQTHVDQTHQHLHSTSLDIASDVYFSLVTIAENIATTVSPIVATYVYDNTLDSFPAANWLVPVAYYTIAYSIHFSMPVHK